MYYCSQNNWTMQSLHYSIEMVQKGWSWTITVYLNMRGGNPIYKRHWISHPVQKVAPIAFFLCSRRRRKKQNHFYFLFWLFKQQKIGKHVNVCNLHKMSSYFCWKLCIVMISIFFDTFGQLEKPIPIFVSKIKCISHSRFFQKIIVVFYVWICWVNFFQHTLSII